MRMECQILHPVGLYAPLAKQLVQIACLYKADIEIMYEKKRVNMKSLMGIISLGVPCFGVVQINIEGPQQNEAFAHLLTIKQPFMIEPLDDVNYNG